jgi:hypothetical protein
MERTRVKGVRETLLRKTFWPKRKEITGCWENSIKVIVYLCMATLIEVFPCFFLSCKVNARVKPARTGHGPHSS